MSLLPAEMPPDDDLGTESPDQRCHKLGLLVNEAANPEHLALDRGVGMLPVTLFRETRLGPRYYRNPSVVLHPVGELISRQA